MLDRQFLYREGNTITHDGHISQRLGRGRVQVILLHERDATLRERAAPRADRVFLCTSERNDPEAVEGVCAARASRSLSSPIPSSTLIAVLMRASHRDGARYQRADGGPTPHLSGLFHEDSDGLRMFKRPSYKARRGAQWQCPTPLGEKPNTVLVGCI